MNWNIFDQPGARQWVEALCLTLMHSLWQGLIAAILAGVILLSTRKSKPALRYNLLAMLMLTFFAGAAVTFWLVSGPFTVPSAAQAAFTQEWLTSVAAPGTSGAVNGVMQMDIIAQIVGFFSRNADVIVTIWMTVFVLKSLQACMGRLYLYKITKSVSSPGMQWVVRFYELAERMGVRREIELAESAQVTAPMVIGFLKPAVLVPLGMLANLPAAQIEAILLHELAHIRRNDYLVNLLQVFCENVFFFHPAVIWISKLIREEREHCCDDLAIGVMQNKTSFIHALVSFQEYNQSRPSLEMAFSKKRNHLLERIKRIINNNNKPLDAMEKLFVSFSLIAAITLSAANSPERPEKPQPVGAVMQKKVVLGEIVGLVQKPIPVAALPDTLPRKKRAVSEMQIHSASVRSPREGISTYNVTRNNKQYEIVQRNGRTISLWVDDREIPESDYGKYQSEIDKILEEVKVQHARAEKQREEAEQMRKAAEGQRRLVEKQREEAHVLRMEAEKQREEAHQQRLEAEKQRQHAEQMRLSAGKGREEAEQMRVLAAKQRGEAEVMRKQADEMRKMAEEQRKAAEKQREEYVKIQEDIIDELTQAGLVKDKETLSYRLSDEELIVNGSKQSAALHQKLKAKYLKDLGDRKFELMYNYRNQNGHTQTGVVHSRE